MAQPAAPAFRSALAKGTGRAVILLRRDPQDPELHAELLHACSENLVFDPQCEPERAPYLCGLIRLTGQQAFYREALEQRLWAAAAANRYWDVQQMFGILVQLAARDDRAGIVLVSFVNTACSPELSGAVVPDLVGLLGLSAVLACLRRFGPDDDWRLIPIMIRALEERDGVEAARSALRAARQADAALDRRLRSFEKQASAPRKADAATSGVDAPRQFPRSWIMGASQKDLERAAAYLLAETDEARVLAYLAIFRLRRFPGDPTRLFPLMDSPKRRVAAYARSALACASHPAIRDFALRMITEGRFGDGAALLRSSHGPGDLVLLQTVLERLLSDEIAYHDVGFWTLDLIKDMTDKPDEARAILLHLYENGPCSGCRGRAVGQLAEMGGVPDWMAEEACHDADPDIAERFRAARS